MIQNQHMAWALCKHSPNGSAGLNGFYESQRYRCESIQSSSNVDSALYLLWPGSNPGNYATVTEKLFSKYFVVEEKITDI